MRVSVAVGHGGADNFGRREAVDFRFCDEAALEEFFANGDAFGDGVNAELTGAVVANTLDHGRDEGRGGGDAGTAFVDIGDNAADTFVGHHETGFAEHVEAVEEAVGDERQKGVEFEIALADRIRNRRIMPNH